MLGLVVVVLERAWRAARWLVEIHFTHLTEKHGRAFNDGRLSPLTAGCPLWVRMVCAAVLLGVLGSLTRW